MLTAAQQHNRHRQSTKQLLPTLQRAVQVQSRVQAVLDKWQVRMHPNSSHSAVVPPQLVLAKLLLQHVGHMPFMHRRVWT